MKNKDKERKAKCKSYFLKMLKEQARREISLRLTMVLHATDLFREVLQLRLQSRIR